MKALPYLAQAHLSIIISFHFPCSLVPETGLFHMLHMASLDLLFTVELLDPNSPFFDHNFLSFQSPPSYFSHSF